MIRLSTRFCSVLFLAAAALPLTAQTSDGPRIVPDTAFSGSWNCGRHFEEKQDYLKNLAFGLIDSDGTPADFRSLLKILRDITDGEGIAVIPEIREAMNSLRIPQLRGVYMKMVAELLENDGKYGAVSENFGDQAKPIVLAFSRSPEQTMEPNTGTIPKALGRTVFGQPLIRVVVDGESVDAWFDTGAEASHISRSLADRIGVRYRSGDSVEIGTVNERRLIARPGYIDSIAIGNVLIRNHPVLVFRDEDEVFGNDSISVKAEMTLGWPAIRGLRTVLDGRSMTYTAEVGRKSEESDPPQNLFWLGFPGVKVNTLSGSSLIFGLDLGLNETELKSNIFAKDTFGSVRTDTVLVGGAAGLQRMQVKVVENYSFLAAGHRLTFPELVVRDNADFVFIHQDGTLGSDLLQKNRLMIDPVAGKFIID